MKHPTLQRHYPIPNLDFRDFWDLVSHFQHVNPRYHMVTYTVEGVRNLIVNDEVDMALVLRKLSTNSEPIRRFTARLFDEGDSEENPYGSAKLVYLPALTDFQDAGLYYYGSVESKLSLYRFEDLLYSNYALEDFFDVDPEFGTPCEVLAVVVDMRGFSTFCEQPHIESPYTCGLMTAFYHTVRQSFIKYPPDMMKFLGDGVLCVWQTGNDDRTVAIDIAIGGLEDLSGRWQNVLLGPHFIHGAPEGVASAVSFGLASRISTNDDYLGRPINLATRLVGACPAGVILIDRNVPGIKDKENLKSKVAAQLKTFGDYKVWAIEP